MAARRTRAIHHLRRRFVAMAMAAVTVVLALIMAGINITNYLVLCQQADARLSYLARFDGQFETIAATVRANKREPGFREHLATYGLSVESLFELRYFTVTVDAEGAVLAVDTERIEDVDADEVRRYVERAERSAQGTGFCGSFRFRAIEGTGDAGESAMPGDAAGPVDARSAEDTGDAAGAGDAAGVSDAGGTNDATSTAEASDPETTTYLFLDCARDLGKFHMSLMASLAVSGAGLLLVLLLAIVLARVVLRPVEESYEKQRRFITDAGHEIKTPLAVIDAATEVLQIEHGESEWTQSIHDQVGRLSALTERLVLLSRMDEGDDALVKREFDLSAVVERVSDPFFAVARARDKELVRRIEPSVRYRGDADVLARAVELLLDNATRYASAGSTIELTLARRGRNVELTVSNAVDELPAGDLDRLFERFYRPDDSRSTQTGGSGIGLSVVRAVAEAHGGTATVSASGNTITFMLTL